MRTFCGIVVQSHDVSRVTCLCRVMHMYLRQRGIDYHLRYLVESQYAFRVAEQENLVTEHGIAPMLACLSARLRDNLRHTLHDRLLQCHVILRIRANRDDKFNLELCRLVHMQGVAN